MVNLLVIGSGGREHALVWKIRQSPRCGKLYCAPGNAGIAALAECVPLAASDLDGLLTFAREAKIDLTVVGPEQPLADGIVDRFSSEGFAIFGPTKEAARIEGSKVFAKEFMRRHNIPTAEFRTFSLEERFDAERYINDVPVPIVLKADGLAAGKGVAVCESKEQALEALDMMMGQRVFGNAGLNVVIEDFLVGEEASVFALTDGESYVLLPVAQDHKRIFDHDRGKNTGGMGSYAPAPVVTAELLDRVAREIIAPTLRGMRQENAPYKGCLYVGLMLTETGPRVVEFNCRFGDPETQAVLPLLESDLLDLLLGSVQGSIGTMIPTFKDRSAVCVVIASGGYPDQYETGKRILGLDTVSDSGHELMVFHAGTKFERGEIVTSGGRVLGVTALGPSDDLDQTIDKAYRTVERITFDGAYYRSDIGRKGALRQKLSQRGVSI